MKELNTNNTGRMPLWQADLDWLQDAFTEPIMAILAELKHDTAVAMPITGCKVTITDDVIISMTSGWFWWNGKMLPVRALGPTKIEMFTAPIVHLEKVTYSNPNGARNFIHADLTTEAVSNVWQDDYLLPTVVERGDASVTTGVNIHPNARTLFDWIRLRIRDDEGSWHPAQSEIPQDNVQYKRVGYMVLLKGSVLVRDGSAMPKVQGLPVPMSGSACLAYNELTHGAIVTIDNQGRLDCISRVGGLTNYSVDGMMYMAEEPFLLSDNVTPVDTDVDICGQIL